MGNMVEISILTDGFGQVEKYPEEFVKTINRAMQTRPDTGGSLTYGIGNHANCLTIHPAHHADISKLYLAGQNRFVDLTEYGVEDRLRTSHRIPDDHFLDAIDDDLDEALDLILGAKAYVKHLREDVGFDVRPGNPDCPLGAHHFS